MWRRPSRDVRRQASLGRVGGSATRLQILVRTPADDTERASVTSGARSHPSQDAIPRLEAHGPLVSARVVARRRGVRNAAARSPGCARREIAVRGSGARCPAMRPGIPHRTRCEAALSRARAARGRCEDHAFDGSCPRSQLRQKSDDDVLARDMPRRGKPKRRIDGYVLRGETRSTRRRGIAARRPSRASMPTHRAHVFERRRAPCEVSPRRRRASGNRVHHSGSPSPAAQHTDQAWGNRPPRSTQEDRGSTVPSRDRLRKGPSLR